MPRIAQFGIIDEFNKDKDYSQYEPEKYNCIAINDNFINDWWSDLKLIKTYFHRYNRPEYALARWGVTLIPPESLDSFYEIVSSDKRSKTSKELIDFIMHPIVNTHILQIKRAASSFYSNNPIYMAV